MSDTGDLRNLPLKVVVFAAHPLAIPTINLLMQEGMLGGVIVPGQPAPFSQQLESWLHHNRLPYVQYDLTQVDGIAPQLQRWEVDLGVGFNFPHPLSEQMAGQLTLGVFQIHAAPLPRYLGPQPLYWQIRNGEVETHLTLLKVDATGNSGDIVMQQPLAIDLLDTLQSLENRVAQQMPVIVGQFINLLREHQGALELTPLSGEGSQAPFPQQADLYVDWASMSSQQIANLARAGNALFGGCILLLGHTPINLLQATPVEHPTYGVKPGTICHIGEPEGVVVATCDGAIRLDVLSSADGIFDGLRFMERFQINAGMEFGVVSGRY